MEAEPSNPPEVYKNAAGFAPPVVTTTVSAGGRTYVNLDSKNWQGGTTTVRTRERGGIHGVQTFPGE